MRISSGTPDRSGLDRGDGRPRGRHGPADVAASNGVGRRRLAHHAHRARHGAQSLRRTSRAPRIDRAKGDGLTIPSSIIAYHKGDSTVRLNLCSAKQSTRKGNIGTACSHTYSSPTAKYLQHVRGSHRLSSFTADPGSMCSKNHGRLAARRAWFRMSSLFRNGRKATRHCAGESGGCPGYAEDLVQPSLSGP